MSIEIVNEHFALSLPEGWLDHSTPEGFAFANKSSQEELIIGIMLVKKPLRRNEIARPIWDLVQLRVKAASQIAAGNFTVLEAAEPTGWLPTQSGFVGIDNANKVYLQLAVIGYPKRFVSIAYFRRNCFSASPELDEDACNVMDGCRVNPA